MRYCMGAPGSLQGLSTASLSTRRGKSILPHTLYLLQPIRCAIVPPCCVPTSPLHRSHGTRQAKCHICPCYRFTASSGTVLATHDGLLIASVHTCATQCSLKGSNRTSPSMAMASGAITQPDKHSQRASKPSAYSIIRCTPLCHHEMVFITSESLSSLSSNSPFHPHF